MRAAAPSRATRAAYALSSGVSFDRRSADRRTPAPADAGSCGRRAAVGERQDHSRSSIQGTQTRGLPGATGRPVRRASRQPGARPVPWRAAGEADEHRDYLVVNLEANRQPLPPRAELGWWRLGLADREERYDGLEARLFEAPVITVPAITIGSDFDGTAADGRAYARMFSGPYSHRVLDGIGHKVPQEAPAAFADAVLAVGGGVT